MEQLDVYLENIKKLFEAQAELIKELEADIAKRPARPLFGEARSRILQAMDNSAHVDDAIEKYDKLQKRIEELEEILAELYTEASYEKAGEWVIDDKDLQKRVKQALKG